MDCWHLIQGKVIKIDQSVVYTFSTHMIYLEDNFNESIFAKLLEEWLIHSKINIIIKISFGIFDILKTLFFYF